MPEKIIKAIPIRPVMMKAMPGPFSAAGMCGVFLVESFSVMMQVGWFKYTKRRYGEGRRILLMSPVHHHYQKKGIF